jgi:urea carboxylase
LDETVIAVTGADIAPTLNGEPIPMWQSVRVKPGDILSGGVARVGCRAYIAIAGGIDTPLFYGSRSTYKYGHLGGFYGELLKKGQRIPIGKPKAPLGKLENRRVKQEIIPSYPKPKVEEWHINVIPGPQDDYYTEAANDMLCRGKVAWKVGLQSDRMGVRLIGPKLEYKPEDQRPPSQDPLAHPSNIPGCHGYAVGTVNICGDTPIILGVDAVSLGGYCCNPTIISADLWKAAQARVGDFIRFYETSYDKAVDYLRKQEAMISEESII